MSWDGYCENMVASAPKAVVNAAILGFDRCVWGITGGGFDVTQSELDNLVDCFEQPSLFFERNITLNGERYFTTRVDVDEDGRSVHGRKDTSGVILIKSSLCFVVALYTYDARSAIEAAERLVTFLLKAGY
eukprot:TRINITY_DN6896_c0_g1_i1.p1 TRINITY_DN6896_c0_g1~~TRINITY_DN6896_c0_g1_i1.p1  ORF type:complete len:131 (+),score=21.97 TRINITY_DN6896_c0_g1_i1:97-489(+)